VRTVEQLDLLDLIGAADELTEIARTVVHGGDLRRILAATDRAAEMAEVARLLAYRQQYNPRPRFGPSFHSGTAGVVAADRLSGKAPRPTGSPEHAAWIRRETDRADLVRRVAVGQAQPTGSIRLHPWVDVTARVLALHERTAA
jgi:hypothetical protein